MEFGCLDNAGRLGSQYFVHQSTHGINPYQLVDRTTGIPPPSARVDNYALSLHDPAPARRQVTQASAVKTSQPDDKETNPILALALPILSLLLMRRLPPSVFLAASIGMTFAERIFNNHDQKDDPAVTESSFLPKGFEIGGNVIAPIITCFLLRHTNEFTTCFRGGIVMAAFGALFDLSKEEDMSAKDFFMRLAGKVFVGALVARGSASFWRYGTMARSTSAITNRLSRWFKTTSVAQARWFRYSLRPAIIKTVGPEGKIPERLDISRFSTAVQTATALGGLGLFSVDYALDQRVNTLVGTWGGCWALTYSIGLFFPIHTTGYFLMTFVSVFEDYMNQKSSGRQDYDGNFTIIHHTINTLIYGVFCDNLLRDGAIRYSRPWAKYAKEIKLPKTLSTRLGLGATVTAGVETSEAQARSYARWKFVYSTLAAPALSALLRWAFLSQYMIVSSAYFQSFIASGMMYFPNKYIGILGVDTPPAKTLWAAAYFCMTPTLTSTSYYRHSRSHDMDAALESLDSQNDSNSLERRRRLLDYAVTTPTIIPPARYLGLGWARHKLFPTLCPSKEDHMSRVQNEITERILLQPSSSRVRKNYFEILEDDKRRFLDYYQNREGGIPLPTMARLRDIHSKCHYNPAFSSDCTEEEMALTDDTIDKVNTKWDDYFAVSD